MTGNDQLSNDGDDGDERLEWNRKEDRAGDFLAQWLELIIIPI